MREGKPLLNEKSEKYRAPLIQTGPSYKPVSERLVFVPGTRLAVSWPLGAVPGNCGQLHWPLPLELELELLEELLLEFELLELELELEVRPLLELLELLLELEVLPLLLELLELLMLGPVSGSAPQAVKAAIEQTKSVCRKAEGKSIAEFLVE
jgi:hypothetical protein